jgi:hypothetical protein
MNERGALVKRISGGTAWFSVMVTGRRACLSKGNEQTALQVISARAYLVTTWGRNLPLPVTILAALNRVTKDPLQIT